MIIYMALTLIKPVACPGILQNASRNFTFDNRPGDLFEPNHVMAMKQCSHVDSQSTSRKISFAGRFAVAGKSEKKTQ